MYARLCVILTFVNLTLLDRKGRASELACLAVTKRPCKVILHCCAFTGCNHIGPIDRCIGQPEHQQTVAKLHSLDKGAIEWFIISAMSQLTL